MAHSHMLLEQALSSYYIPKKNKSLIPDYNLSEGVFKDSDISMAPDEEKHHNWLYDLSSPVALTTNLIIK